MADRYRAALEQYLASGDEAGLEAAYAHGRRAVATRCSVLDLATAHHDALAKIDDLDPVTVERAGAFLAECLSAFEMTFRGFFEASRTAELQAEHAERLRGLAAAAAALNASLSSDEVRRVIGEEAQRLIGAGPAVPGQRALSVPLVGADGTEFGVLAVAEPGRGFSEADEAILAQLAQMASVALENARLFEREQLIAETLQRSLLTDRLQSFPGAQLAARYVPGGDGSDVGGDWYDAFLVPGGLAVTVGDVTGKGIHAAALMGQLRTALRAYALEGHDPADVVVALDRLLYGLDESRMATTVYGVFDAQWRTLTFASAGHPPPLLVAPDGTATYLEGALSLPLGVDACRRRVADTVAIPPGSTLLLYTDGLVEQRTRALDEGLDRLRAVAAAAPTDLEAFCDSVLDAMLPGGEPDDVAVLAVRVGDPDG